MGRGFFFCCSSGDAGAAPLALIPNYGDGTVSVIDTAIDQVVATLGTGMGPTSVAVDPSGMKAYVVNSGGQSVSVIDLFTLSVSTPLSGAAVGSGAFAIAVSPDSAHFYVTNRYANTVFAYDAATPSFLGGVGYFDSVPLGVTVDSEGVIYVTVHAGPGGTGANGPGYAKIDPPPDLGWNMIAPGVSPNGIAVTGGPAGGHRQVYFADEGANAVKSWDPTRYPYPYLKSIPVGTQPYGVAVSPDSARLYVTNTGAGTLSIVDVATDTVVATVPVGTQPRGVAAHPDGRRVYVANAGSNTVSVVDAGAAGVVTTIPVGSSPGALGQFIKPFCTNNADCDDGLSCTTDSCDLTNGICNHTNNCATPTPTPLPARNVSLVPGSATIGVGESVTLHLHIDDTSEIIYYTFGLTYDSSFLAFQSMTLNTPSWCTAQANAAYAGKICIAISCPNHLYPANNPDLATIQFVGGTGGLASIAFDTVFCGSSGVPACDLQRDGGGLFPCNRAGASIQVTGATATPTDTPTATPTLPMASTLTPTHTHTHTPTLNLTPTSTPSLTASPTSPADADGDTVPDTADNCPTIFNPGQDDLDGDNLGDVCDAVDAELTITRISVHPDTRPATDNGYVTARGTYVAGPHDALDIAAGVAVRLRDGAALDHLYQWPADQCTTLSRGGVRCLSADGTKRLVIRPSQGSLGTYAWRLRCRRQGFTGTFGGPVDLALTHVQTAIDRVGSASACTMQRNTLVCTP